VAIAFLVFMFPLPHRLETALSQPLQQVASAASVYTLQTLGWPAFREGNILLVHDYRIGVVEACNGLGMLLSFFAVAAGTAVVCSASWAERIVLFLSSVPIAILANVARIVATSVLYDLAGPRWGELVFHDLAGWLMMPLALGLLCVERKVVSWLMIDDALGELPEMGVVPAAVDRHGTHWADSGLVVGGPLRP
jgi:exosortase